jgi:hypothetical protein
MRALGSLYSKLHLFHEMTPEKGDEIYEKGVATLNRLRRELRMSTLTKDRMRKGPVLETMAAYFSEGRGLTLRRMGEGATLGAIAGNFIGGPAAAPVGAVIGVGVERIAYSLVGFLGRLRKATGEHVKRTLEADEEIENEQ